jgi:hypothetical protein
MSIIDIDDLKKEKNEEMVEHHDPAGRIVKALFSEELSGHKWTKYSREDIIKLIDEKAKKLNIPENESHVFLLRRALRSKKTAEEMIMRMTSFLIGDAQ